MGEVEGCVWHYCKHLSEGVYPTPFYETVFAFIIFGILWSLRKRIKIPGIIFFIYVLLNGIERFFIEKIRTNPDIDIFGIQATQAEYIAFLLIVIGIVGIVVLYIRHERTDVRREA